MKKITTMAYVAALALVSTAGLTSCKSDEPGNGNYSGETVKTEFAISLPFRNAGAAAAGPNRMPGAIVQDGVTPSNVTNFQGITGIQLVPFSRQTGAIAAGDKRLGAIIALSGDVDKTDAARASSAKVYSNVSIPLSTASFLFYGRSAATSDTIFKIGSLSATINVDDPANMHFDLDPINSTFSSTYMGSTGIGGKLMEYLTHVAIASDGDETTPKRWYEYTASDNAAIKAMFDTYTSMHGLSSFEVERVLTDLGKSLRPLYSTSAIAKAIIDSIGSDYVIATTVTSDVVTLSGDYHTFPQKQGLPMGSLDMAWNGTSHAFEEGIYKNMASPESYVYPAQLWYYVNSTILTSNTSRQTLYNSTNTWATILAAHTDAKSVNTKTRAVAIKDSVQYAVGRLDVDVKLDASTLADNSLASVGKATDVDCAGGFRVTAILVGGQKQVGFDFTPIGSSEFTIFDSLMNVTSMKALSSDYSAMNHTLVLESSAGSDVNIAVEMINDSGVDFYGIDKMLIPKGGRFYVVGKLLATAATETGSKVFKQDYTTIAHLNLKSLKNAYSTLPDLRTPQLELGFSVDLKWKTGHTYAVDIE